MIDFSDGSMSLADYVYVQSGGGDSRVCLPALGVCFIGSWVREGHGKGHALLDQSCPLTVGEVESRGGQPCPRIIHGDTYWEHM